MANGTHFNWKLNGWARVILELLVVFCAIVVSFIVVREDVRHLEAEVQRIETQSYDARILLENRLDNRLARIEDKLDRILEER